MKMQLTTQSRGEITAQVYSANGKIKQEISKSNLLTNRRAGSGFFFDTLVASACYLNTGATNPRVEPDAGTTFTKVNNLITRGGSAWDCSILREGDQIKLSDDSRVVVESVIDADSFTTYDVFFSPESFAAQSGVVYLTRESESSSDNQPFGLRYNVADDVETIVSVEDRDTWSGQNEFQINFPPAGEAGVVNFFGVTGTCRVFLPTPLVLEAEDFVIITYRVFVNSDTGGPVQHFPDYNAAGWPHRYNITSMSSDGSNILMTVDDDHHYEAGDTLLVQNSTPTQIPLTNITSNGSTITIDSVGHGFSVGQDIGIVGTNNYDGDYNVSSVIDSDSFTVASGLNVAAETSGFVHDATPDSFYNEEFVVSSIPAPNQIELVSTLNESTTNNGVVSVPNTGFTFTDVTENGFYRSQITRPVNFQISSTQIYDPLVAFPPSSSFGSSSSLGINQISLLPQENLTGGEDLATRQGVSFFATRDYGRLRQFRFFASTTDVGFLITFDHIQTKKDFYALNLFFSQAHLQELN